MAEQQSILDVARETGALQDEEQQSILDVARASGIDPGVNTTPIPVERSHQKTFKNRRFGDIHSEIKTPDWKTTAADNGIMFDNPSPVGHYLSGFAANEEQRAHAFAKELSQHYGREMQVRTGPKTGRLEWFDPKHARWSLVDPPGWNKGDLANMAGPAISIGIETGIMVLAFGGSAMSGGFVGTALLGMGAGPIAAMAGEGTRIAMGVKMGINQEIDENKVASHLADVGTEAGAWGIAGELGYRVGKRSIDFLLGRTTSQQLLEDVSKLRRETITDTDVPTDFKRAAELQESVDEKLMEGLRQDAERMGFDDLESYLDAVEVDIAHRQFSVRLDQATQNENLLTFGEVLKKDAAFADLFKAQEKEQQAALQRYFELVNRPFKTVTQRDGGNRAVGANLQSRMQGAVDNAVSAQDQFVAAKAAQLETMTTGLRSTPTEAAGEPFRFIVGKQDEALRKWADEVTDQIDTLTGNAEIIPIRRTATLANELADKERKALFKAQKEEYKKIIGERRMETTTEQGGLVLDGQMLEFDEIEAERAIDALFNPDSVLTFQDAWDGLKSLKRLRRAAKSDPSEPYNAAALDGMIDALEKDLAEGMPDAAKELYDTFRVQYRAETNRLRRGIVGEMMRKDPATGNYVIENAKVFDQVFTPGGTRNAEQWLAAINGSHDHMMITRRALIDNWKKSVQLQPDGTFNKAAHRRWMDGHRKQAELFLDNREMAALKRGAGVQQALEARIANRKKALKEINESLPARVANYKRPEMIVNDMLVPGNEQFAADVMHILNDQPFPPEDLIREIRSGIRQKVVDRVTNAQGPDLYDLSPKKLKGLLFGNNNSQKNLRIIMGDEYVDDLILLNEALDLASSRPGASNFSNTAPAAKAVMDLTRAYVGLFTRAGRVVTAANRVRGRAANRALVSAIAEPGNLRKLMALSNTPRTDPRYAQFLTEFGALGVLTPDEFDQEQFGNE